MTLELDATGYISPLPVGWMLGPVRRGHWRDTANLEEKEGPFSSVGVLFFYLVATGSVCRGPGRVSSRGGWFLGRPASALQHVSTHSPQRSESQPRRGPFSEFLSFFTICFSFSFRVVTALCSYCFRVLLYFFLSLTTFYVVENSLYEIFPIHVSSVVYVLWLNPSIFQIPIPLTTTTARCYVKPDRFLLVNSLSFAGLLLQRSPGSWFHWSWAALSLHTFLQSFHLSSLAWCAQSQSSRWLSGHLLGAIPTPTSTYTCPLPRCES